MRFISNVMIGGVLIDLEKYFASETIIAEF